MMLVHFIPAAPVLALLPPRDAQVHIRAIEIFAPLAMLWLHRFWLCTGFRLLECANETGFVPPSEAPGSAMSFHL